VRQLENTIFRAVVLCDEEMLDVADFPQIAGAMGVALRERAPLPELSPAARPVLPQANPPRAATAYGVSAADASGHMRKLEDIEAEIIKMAIDRYSGRMSEVARRLGIGRSTLYRKLKEYGLEGGEDGPGADDESSALKSAG
jgi:DNA-binding NtrC family response regulator